MPHRLLIALAVMAASLSSLSLNAQPVRVDVRLQQPPPNQVRIADLWKIELNNRSSQTVVVFLRGTVEELSIPDGLIAEAFSTVIELPPGLSRLTGRDVQPVDVPEYDQRYYDALIRTGNVPSGEYEICVEVLDESTSAILGRDCKFVTVERLSVPILISPPDLSEVLERYPVMTWMPSVPPTPGMDLRYRLRLTEIFGRQTAQDAMIRNPAWLELKDLRRTLLQYPVSMREMELNRRYAWMVEAYEIRGTVLISMGESEVWEFTYAPLHLPDEDEEDRGKKAVLAVGDSTCPGENWGFEIGTLACWEVSGEAFIDDPINDKHPVLGSNGHNGKWWVSSYGQFDADKSKGAMLSQLFQIQNSNIGFLFGGIADRFTGVELMVEKLDKDTFSLPVKTLPGSTKEWYVAHSTSETDNAGSSERLVPIEWDVLPYLNRGAYILISDSSDVGHLNVDQFRFYDREEKDKIKLPVLVMAAGENHSLAATPKEPPTLKMVDNLKGDLKRVQGGSSTIKGVNVVNQTSAGLKGKMASAMKTFSSGAGTETKGSKFDLGSTELSKEVKASRQISSLVLKIKPDNIVWGWGDNLDKAVGPSLPSVVKEPKKVKNVEKVQSLAAGPWHSLAVMNDGTAKGWGLNKYAQLGTGDRSQHSTPTKILTLTTATKIATGAFHSLAITNDGSLFFWGWNRFHGLGFPNDVWVSASTGQVDSTVFVYKPYPNMGLSNIIDVAVGEAHSVLLKANGQVLAWGANERGQTGQPITEPITETVKFVTVSDNSDMLSHQMLSVAAGFDHTLVLGKDGTVWSWGGNASGQLGDGTAKDRPKAKQIPGLGGIVAIAAGDGFSLAIDSTGHVWAWGNNVLGQLGDGTRVGTWSPVQVNRIDAVQGIVAGGSHAMAVRTDGSLWTWGTNDYGQLGEGPVTNLIPVPMNPPIGPLRVERLAQNKK